MPNLLGRLQAMKEWEHLGSEATIADVYRLGEKYNITVGKWMLFQTSDRVDTAWRRLVTALLGGTLGPVVGAKVSPLDDLDGDGRHVICIYTEDFLNKEQVMEAESCIRGAKLFGQLMYKPDIFTYFGIYRNNEWKISPTIYTSQFSLSTNSSLVKESGSKKVMGRVNLDGDEPEIATKKVVVSDKWDGEDEEEDVK